LFEIYWKDRPVGHVAVEKEGLYFRFICTCTLPDSEIYRISVTDGINRYDLGIYVPGGVTARLPCKCLEGDNLSFTLRENQSQLVSVPVATGVPFDYLDQLETARLLVTDGQPEILINPVQDLLDSGQNP